MSKIYVKLAMWIFLFAVMGQFTSAIALANTQKIHAFEIPRSNIVDITDPDTARVYSIFIKLPRSYNKNTKQLYPVIYLTDALYSFQLISGATRFPMNTGKMAEAIIVGLSYSKGDGGHASRVRDYTHSKNSNWKYPTGNAKQYISFVESSVFSYIESHYRVSNTRVFVGNSLGGLLGAYILLTKPTMFNHYILGSPSVWFKDDDILKLSIIPNLNAHKVFIGVGANETVALDSPNHDMVKGARDLKMKISPQYFPNTEVKLHIIPEANHETAFPTTAIQGLYWLLKR